MKRQLLHFTLLLLACLAVQAQELKVCTYNLRYKNTSDTNAGNGWNTRRTYLINFVNFQQPDLLGVQEAVKSQMTDMASGLKDYAYIGVGRDNGIESGEYSAIFYRTERMVLLDNGDFWLSDTPWKPSKGFPSKGGSTTYSRICTWGKFFDKATGTVVYHFNTHMDLDETNRQQSFFLIKQKLEEIAGKDFRNAPIIISGDYNAVQTGETYKLFYNSGFLFDCFARAKQKFITNGTCPGFNANNYSSVGSEYRRIDHIFVTRAFTVEHYGVLNPCYYSTSGSAEYNERAFSDHSPVIAKLTLRTPELAELDTTLPPAIDNIFQISSASELQAFSRIVNGLGGYAQNSKAKAVLTADIDLAEADEWVPIGRSSTPFSGTFDGQGHSVRNLVVNTHRDNYGLFGKTTGATIQNFSIEGNVTCADGTGYGTVGWSEGSTIRGVHSALNIASMQVSHHIGGIVGSMRSGTKAVGCSFSGTITDTAGTTDCLGGIAGYTNENCAVEDCANYGSIIFTDAEAYAGGIIGYVNNNTFAGVKNSLNVGTIGMDDGTPTYSGAIGGRIRAHAASAFQNNYWLEGSAAAVSGENLVEATQVTASQLASGEVCYRLNGDQTDIRWYQILGYDPYPLLHEDHLKVLYKDGIYYNDDPDNIRELKDAPGLEAPIFNLAGQRLQKLQRGINIVNGKKVLF